MRNKQQMICRIIKSLAVNYPILLAAGCGFEKLLMLIIRQGEMGAIISVLDGDNPQLIHNDMTSRKISQILTLNNSVAIFYPYSPDGKSQGIVRQLSIVMKTGTLERQKILTLPIIISEGVPLNIDMSECFSIYFNGGLKNIVDQELDVVPPDSQVPVVLDRIKEYTGGTQIQEERALKAAVSFLYPILEETEEGIAEYLKVVEDLVFSDDENQDTNNLGESFLRELYKWQDEKAFHRAYELPCLGTEVTKSFEQVILYDEQFIFMKDSLFKEISENLLRVISMDILKNSLRQEKILCPGQTRTYTVKVNYYNVAGEFNRVRMLRFDRSRLKIVGEIDFIEFCTDGKES